MDDFERANLVDLADAYRQLYAAVLERAFDDLLIPKYAADAWQFFVSGYADVFADALGIDPDRMRKIARDRWKL